MVNRQTNDEHLPQSLLLSFFSQFACNFPPVSCSLKYLLNLHIAVR